MDTLCPKKNILLQNMKLMSFVWLFRYTTVIVNTSAMRSSAAVTEALIYPPSWYSIEALQYWYYSVNEPASLTREPGWQSLVYFSLKLSVYRC